MEQDCTQVALPILCNDSTGWDEMGDYFAKEADTMVEIVRLTWIKIDFEYLYLTGIFIKLSHLYVNYYFLVVCLCILVLYALMCFQDLGDPRYLLIIL